MTFRKVFLIMATAFIISALPALSMIGSGDDPVGSGPDATEIDYDITVSAGDVLEISGEDIIMNGSIYVYGALFVNDSKIRFGGTSDGQYGVYVYSNGYLHVDNCNVTAFDTETYVSRPNDEEWDHTWGIHWKFEVYGNMFLNESELSYIWGETPSGLISEVNGGIQIYSDNSKNVLVRNCTIFNTENAGIYIGDDNPGSIHSSSPSIHNTTVDNSTGPGIIACGDNVKPNIQNCTFRGNNYKGGNFYYGASGFMANCTFTRNRVFGFSFDPIDETSMMTINDCHFDGNYGTGYRARRGGILDMKECTFNGNDQFGLDLRWYNPNPSVSPPRDVPVINLQGGQVKDNGHHGIGPTWDICKGSFYEVEVSGNNGHGIITNSSGMEVNFGGCNVHDNMGWGLYLNGSKGSFSYNTVRDNRLGGIMISNESQGVVERNIVDNSNIPNDVRGIYTVNSLGSINLNEVKNNHQGFVFEDSEVEEMFGNQIESNTVGMVVKTDNFTIEQNNMSGNTNIGLHIFRSTDLKIRNCIIDGSQNGIRFTDGMNISVNQLEITGTTTTAIEGSEGAEFKIENSTISTDGGEDLILDGGSVGHAVNTTIDPSKVTIMDDESRFMNHWLLTAHVVDNITMEGIPRAQYVIFSKNEMFHNKELVNVTSSSFGGIGNVPVLTYQMEGQNPIYNYNPVQLTIWKEGYAPYIGDAFDMTKSLILNLEMPVNQPPLLLDFESQPVETHQRRPQLQWSEAWDWNNDEIQYRLNIYKGSVDPENLIGDFTDIIVNTNHLNVTRNLQFHKTYYVVVKAEDPWGLSDSRTYSFRTINSKPTAPTVEVVKNPVSPTDDIEVRIIENSTDADTNPVDDITYFIEFYKMRAMSNLELIQSGNSRILTSDKTSEQDVIMVVVKPFDGIEYGTPVRINVTVQNFLPHAVQQYKDFELEEDTTLENALDLNTMYEDGDGDQIFFEVARSGHVSASIDPITGIMDLIPDEDWNGEDYLIIQADDLKPHGDEPYNTVRINVTVTGSSDPPRITEINTNTIKSSLVTLEGIQGSQMSIFASADDPDLEYGDELTFSTNFDEIFDTDLLDFNFNENADQEGKYSFDEERGEMNIPLPNEIVGTTEFNITVTDQTGLTNTITIRMIVENKNDPPYLPVILSPSEGSVIEQGDEGIEFVAGAWDDPDLHIPDSDENLEYSWDFGDGQTMENTGEKVNHLYAAPGNYTVTLMVTDRSDVMRSTSIGIQVEMEDQGIDYKKPEGESFLEENGWIVIAVIIGVIAIVVALVFIFRKEPLQEVATKEEEAHEALMAKQQEEALKAQETLQAIMSGQATQEGPALPSAEGGGEQYEALPSAGGEGQEPPQPEEAPQEGEQPGYQQPPEQPQYQAPPAEQPQQPEQPQYQAPPTEQVPPEQQQPQYQAPPTEQQPQAPPQDQGEPPKQQTGTVPGTQEEEQQQNLPQGEDQNQQ